MSDIHHSIVIPCYGSGRWLPDLVDQIDRAMAPYQPFELILVNDPGPDADTWPAIEAVARQHAFVRGVELAYHVGQFKATLCGLELAAGHYVITLDDDFQNPPEEIPKLIQAMREHPDMDCIMGEYGNDNRNPLRQFGSALMQKIFDFFYDKPPGIVTSSFRIMPVQFARTLLLYRLNFPQLGPMIIQLSKKIMNIPVEHHRRPVGRSGYRFFKLVKETYRSVINVSILPLRLFSAVGFLTAGMAFIMGIFYFWSWMAGDVGFPGFTSLILVITFFSGMLLAGIGVLGEYIGRIIQEVTGMPRYKIRRQVGRGQDAND